MNVPPTARPSAAMASAGGHALTETTAGWLVLALIVVSLVVRLAAAASLGLSVDEAYTVVMSRHLAVGYFDHPPLMYWLAGMATRFSGTEAPLPVRVPFVLVFAGTNWLLFRLGCLLFGAPAGLLGAVLVNLVLFFTFCAAGWVLPDGPLLFASAAAALCLSKALFGPERTARGYWLGFGAATGLALLSKYHGFFLLAGTAAFLVLTPSQRRWLRRPDPWLAMLVALAMFSPVVLWNAAHGWSSFGFQGGRAALIAERRGSPFLDSIVGQALWITPWLWLPLLLAVLAALARGPRDERRFLLACLAAGPILTFTLITALGVHGLAHWQAPGYFFAVPLLGAAVAERLALGSAWTRRWLVGSALASGLLVAALGSHASSGWITERAPRLLSLGDPTLDLIPWDPVARQLAVWKQPPPGAVVAGARWSEAGKLAHVLGPRFPVTSVGEDPRGFRLVAPQEELLGRDVLLVASRRDRLQEPMVAYAPYFERIEPLGSVPMGRGQRTEFLVSVYLAHGLRRPIPEKLRH